MNQTKIIEKVNWIPFFVQQLSREIKDNKVQETTKIYSYVKMPTHDDGKLVCFSKQVLEGIFDIKQIDQQEIEDFICGKLNPFVDKNYSMAYSGHQFGVWAGQLGDGRVVNYGEIKNKSQLWTIQIKGAGLTPYSRFADGNAVLRSTIREHLASEAMFNLGIPTTRSLGVVKRKFQVKRDIMYNGNVQMESGSLNCRLAQSFVRIGNFQHMISKNDIKGAELLLNFVVDNYFQQFKNQEQKYFLLFEEVVEQSAKLVALWQAFGFVHGVLNTDNHSIYGLTIDYGPYGFMEKFDQEYTANVFGDFEKRYCYQNQPQIILWNLYQFANCLMPILQDKQQVQSILDKYQSIYDSHIKDIFTQKFGFEYLSQEDFDDLYNLTMKLLDSQKFDFTLFFSELGRNTSITDLSQSKILDKSFIEKTCYLEDPDNQKLQSFEQLYQQLLRKYEIDEKDRQNRMNSINPAYILRNWFLQEVVDQIEANDFEMLQKIEQFIQNPFELNEQYKYFYQKTPKEYTNKPKFCSLSCSSQLIYLSIFLKFFTFQAFYIFNEFNNI